MAVDRTFLCWHTSEWAAFGAVLTALLTLGLIVLASVQLRQVVAAQIEQTRPYVSLRPTFRGQMLCLTLENTGRSAAHDVKVTFDAQPTSYTPGQMDWLSTPLFTGEGMEQLPPGLRVDYFLDVMFNRPRDAMRIGGIVSYRWLTGNRRGEAIEPFAIDLRSVSEALLEEKGVRDLYEEAEKLRKIAERWTDPQGGLAVVAVDRLERDRRDHEAMTKRRELREARARAEWPPPAGQPKRYPTGPLVNEAPGDAPVERSLTRE